MVHLTRISRSLARARGDDTDWATAQFEGCARKMGLRILAHELAQPRRHEHELFILATKSKSPNSRAIALRVPAHRPHMHLHTRMPITAYGLAS